MNAAFNLFAAAPAPFAHALAGTEAGRARRAANRDITIGQQRMPRQVARGDVGFQVFGRPVRQRVDLDPPVHRLDRRQRFAPTALETLAPGNPGGKPIERPVERLDLAQQAAAIGVMRVQVPPGVDGFDARRVDRNLARVGQPQTFGHQMAVAQRFDEVAAPELNRRQRFQRFAYFKR